MKDPRSVSAPDTQLRVPGTSDLPALSIDIRTGYHFNPMSCNKGTTNVKLKPGRFKCTDCGAVAKKRKGVCEPKKVRKKK